MPQREPLFTVPPEATRSFVSSSLWVSPFSLTAHWPFLLLHMDSGRQFPESREVSEQSVSCCLRLRPSLGQGVYPDPVTSSWDVRVRSRGSLPTQETP